MGFRNEQATMERKINCVNRMLKAPGFQTGYDTPTVRLASFIFCQQVDKLKVYIPFFLTLFIRVSTGTIIFPMSSSYNARIIFSYFR